MSTRIEAPRRCVNTPGLAQEIGLPMLVKDTCSIEGCERTVCARGWCGMHYNRWHRRGSVEKRPRIYDFRQLFWSKVDKLGVIPDHRPDLGRCWDWTASLNVRSGYGQASLNRKMRPAHVVSYELEIGSVPDGLVLDHLCRRRNCVNPAHLEPVTLAENTRRGMSPSAIAVRTNHCLQGHEFTEANTVSRANGKRMCRTCDNAAQRRRRQAKRETAS